MTQKTNSAKKISQNIALLAHQKPRERLIDYGEKALSNQELLAILLRTGYQEKNAMLLSLDILQQFHDLYMLKTAVLEELMSIKGIGQVKAIEIKAAIELGYRINQAEQAKNGTVTSSKMIGQMMSAELKDLQQEHFVVMYLNTKNEILKKETLFIGSLNQSIAHPREIFRGAVKYAAARIIICHNHPSGNPTPSREDILFTHRILECGEMMGIQLLDHIIVGQTDYWSMKEQGDI